MSVKKYKFISPGVFVKEIDNSALPKEPNKIGPLIIGRTNRGPAMRPVQINSFAEFVDVFGAPNPGGQGSDDVWRNNAVLAPTYAAYAAQAWLANSSPINVIRLLGNEHTNYTSPAGAAGWMTKDSDGAETTVGIKYTDGGAYGLFLIASSSTGDGGGHVATGGPVYRDSTPATGALAAVFYIKEGAFELSGAVRGSGSAATETTASNATLFRTNAANYEFIAQIKNNSGTVTDKITFNFNRASENYIRKVFNTNPTLTNDAVTPTDSRKTYWLGETYDRWVANGDGGITYGGVGGGAAAGDAYGLVLGLEQTSDSTTFVQWSNHRYGSQQAQSGWIVGQDLGEYTAFNSYALPKLFKVHALKSGQWDMHNLKVSISNIKVTSNNIDEYGTFDLLLRNVSDTDGRVEIVERFPNCNLNPNSSQYVARVVGDKYIAFSSTERRNIEYGQYDNNSKFIRIEMDQAADEGSLDAALLPFGYYGPAKFTGFTVIGTASVASDLGTNYEGGPSSTTAFSQVMARGGANITDSHAFSSAVTGGLIQVGFNNNASRKAGFGTATHFTGSFLFPSLGLRLSGSDGGLKSIKQAYFGLDTNRAASSNLFAGDVKDIVRPLPGTLNSFTNAASLAGSKTLQFSHIFTLDNVRRGADGIGGQYISGSRRAGTSYTATTGSYTGVLDADINNFTLPLFGGFDGFDINEKDPFRNTGMGTSATELNNYAYNSIKESIDIVSDPETLDMNAVAIPGIYQSKLTQHLIDTCEDRADALAIIDLEGDYKPAAENTETYKTRVDNATVATTVNNLKDRNLDSSYGAAYFPWVQILDPLADRLVYTPPSVVALGTISNSQNKSELWFAPAGFNRGGLTGGAAGVPVVGITQKLTSKDRDTLYEANINPIASFPSEGIVVFGQKTLQITPSALDRINVRRLMIFLKKEISRIANGILFDQNVQVTWNRFTGKVEPFLRSVQSGLGLTEYKVVLDNSTTTPDLIDRNILYAKIFLKPARAIEYIAIDFNISNTGAAFDD